jgi:hypothetical protein
MEQRRLQVFLELFDPTGDDRGRDVQLACRLDEALGLRDAHKGLNALKSVHRFPRLQYSRNPNNSALIVQ